MIFLGKFIYWSGLINVFTLLFAGLVFSLIITMGPIFVTPIGIWFLISIFPSDLFRRKILDGDKIAMSLQLFFLVVIAVASLIMTLETYLSPVLSRELMSYLAFMVLSLSTIGVFIGVIPILLMYIASVMNLELTMISLTISIISSIYIAIIVIYYMFREKSEK